MAIENNPSLDLLEFVNPSKEELEQYKKICTAAEKMQPSKENARESVSTREDFNYINLYSIAEQLKLINEMPKEELEQFMKLCPVQYNTIKIFSNTDFSGAKNNNEPKHTR